MVKPSQKKLLVTSLIKKYEVSKTIACSLVGLSRSSFYYQSTRDDSETIAQLKKYVDKYPNRGFDKYYQMLRREGYQWSRNRVLRVYRDEGLVKHQKRRRKLPEGLKKPLKQTERLNEVWTS